MPNALSKPLFQVSKKQVDLAQAKAIVKLKRQVNKLNKTRQDDVHFYDVAQALTPGTTAAIGSFTINIPNGTTESSRNGEQVTLRSLRFSATLSPNAAAASDAGRIIIFRWKSATSGTAPTVGQILSSTTNIDSPYNPDYSDSLVVLYDRKLDVSDANGTKHIRFNKSLKNAKATYTSTSTGAFNENQVFFLYLFAENTNKATISYYSRVNFLP